MAKKQRRELVESIIKTLLDSEIPEIQAQAKKLAEQIKKLEEHSQKLREYISQLESLASEEASVVVEGKITELLSNLDSALSELRKRSKKVVPVVTEARARAATEEISETTPPREQMEYKEEEVVLPRPATSVEKYTTPEGFVIRKTRR